jgi:hypothetical protein
LGFVEGVGEEFFADGDAMSASFYGLAQSFKSAGGDAGFGENSGDGTLREELC